MTHGPHASARPRTWPRVTMKDVAREANVSDATVSRVLGGTAYVSDATREAVLDAIRRTGYVRNGAARQLAGSALNVVGLLLRDVRNPYYGYLHSELQSRSSQHGLRLLTVSPSGTQGVPEESTGLQHLLEQRVRGILVATGMLPIERLAPFAAYVPIVVIGRPVDLGQINSIAYDETDNGQLAADEVLRRGHRAIAVVATTPEVSLVESARATAMIARIRERGGTPVPVPAPTFGSLHDATARIAELARDKAITAAMFPSDERLLAFLGYARDIGLGVPQELSVTGVDGVLPGLDLLGLSTVRLPIETVARRAIEVIAGQVAGPGGDGPVREVYPATFIAGRTLEPVDPARTALTPHR